MPIKTHHEEQPALNLTPMIDVLFLLIIFFMVGARFTDEERKINLQVPTVGGADIQSGRPRARVISVFRDGRLALDGQPLDLDQLVAQLRRDQRDAPRLAVSVRGDADGPFQNVASVLGACRTAGISEMAISVRLTR